MTMPKTRSASPPVVAEIIAVGSELLVGGRTDSNSLLITDELGRLGLVVRFKSIVGDDRADIVRRRDGEGGAGGGPLRGSAAAITPLGHQGGREQ